jgi:hypothetical protein
MEQTSTGAVEPLTKVADTPVAWVDSEIDLNLWDEDMLLWLRCLDADFAVIEKLMAHHGYGDDKEAT